MTEYEETLDSFSPAARAIYTRSMPSCGAGAFTGRPTALPFSYRGTVKSAMFC